MSVRSSWELEGRRLHSGTVAQHETVVELEWWPSTMTGMMVLSFGTVGSKVGTGASRVDESGDRRVRVKAKP
jgi:hypothetical protein